jgi:hypothetical protein
MKKQAWTVKPPDTHLPMTLVIKKYDRDTVYSFKNGDKEESQGTDEKPVPRGDVYGFSMKSRRRCRLVLRNIARHMKLTFGLTYPADFPTDGRRVKRNLGALLDWLRRRKIGYFWIIEFQERGAPHFHGFLTELVTHGEFSAAWNRIISADRPEYFGDPAHLEHGVYVASIESQDKLASYFTEYMKKLEQKTVPEQYSGVGRFWGFTSALLSVQVQTVTAGYGELSRLVRPERKRYIARCRDWGFKWKWKGLGWVQWDEKN